MGNTDKAKAIFTMAISLAQEDDSGDEDLQQLEIVSVAIIERQDQALGRDACPVAVVEDIDKLIESDQRVFP